MTQEAFQKIMEPIAKVFGDKQYMGRMHLIFDIVKELPEQNLKQIVKFFLETRSTYQPPMASDFREAAQNEWQKLHGNRTRNRSDILDLQHGSGALEKVLEGMGVLNLTEAIEKRKRQNNEGA